MSDFGRDLRNALAVEAATAAAPPFDGLLRRHRQRKARRAIAAAAAVVAIAGGIAAAVPRGQQGLEPVTPPRPTRPIAELNQVTDAAANDAIVACMGARGFLVPSASWTEPEQPGFARAYDDCAAASGYDGGLVVRMPRLLAGCEAFKKRPDGMTVVGSGRHLGKPWELRVGAVNDDGYCVLVWYDGRLLSGADSYAAGKRPWLSWDLTPGGPAVFAGAVDPAAVRIAATFQDVAVQPARAATVLVPGVTAAFYAVLAPVSEASTYRIDAYDAAGHEVDSAPR
jgi:hypothetical protein